MRFGDMTDILKTHKFKDALRHRSAIVAAIGRQKAASPSSKLGIGGSWAGPKTLFADPDTAPLAEWLQSIIPGNPEQIDAWGVEHAIGDSLAPHDHIKAGPNAINAWAGVYFIQSGGLFCYGQTDHKPKAGTALIFAADMIHWTQPATQARTSIAFNVIA